MNIVETFGSTAATLGGGFFVGVLIGYALKKVIKLVSVIVGLFLAGLAYLQSQQIATINWNRLQQVSEGAITTLANSIIMQIPDFVPSVKVWMLGSPSFRGATLLACSPLSLPFGKLPSMTSPTVHSLSAFTGIFRLPTAASPATAAIIKVITNSFVS
jgi:uncharacterized membrane protein (Fun14 family)